MTVNSIRVDFSRRRWFSLSYRHGVPLYGACNLRPHHIECVLPHASASQCLSQLPRRKKSVRYLQLYVMVYEELGISFIYVSTTKWTQFKNMNMFDQFLLEGIWEYSWLDFHFKYHFGVTQQFPTDMTSTTAVTVPLFSGSSFPNRD